MFDDVRLPANIESDARGGPSFNTTIQTYGNGREKRNANWSRQRMVYDIGYGIQNASDYMAVLAFFYARRGRAVGFRFKDWGDYIGAGQVIGQGDGNTRAFQLTKLYVDTLRPYLRKITRPVVGSVVAYDGGRPVAIVADGQPGGLLTLAQAPAGVVSVDFQFDVPVRFDVDELDMQFPTALAATISGVKLIELLEYTE